MTRPGNQRFSLTLMFSLSPPSSLPENQYTYPQVRLEKKGTPGAPEALPLPQPKSLLVFTARSYGDFFSWHWIPGLGGVVWGWDPLLLGEPLQLR